MDHDLTQQAKLVEKPAESRSIPQKFLFVCQFN